MNIHCEFSSRFHSDSKRIRSGFESKRRESPRIHNVFAQQYGFANFGRVFTVIRCETLSWECQRRRNRRNNDFTTYVHNLDEVDRAHAGHDFTTPWSRLYDYLVTTVRALSWCSAGSRRGAARSRSSIWPATCGARIQVHPPKN